MNDLRIEGVASLPDKVDVDEFKDSFDILLISFNVSWSGNIVPKEDSTGMSLYKVEWVNGLENQISTLELHITQLQEKEYENNEVTKSLAAQLEQKEKELLKLATQITWKEKEIQGLEGIRQIQKIKLESQNAEIQALETKLRLKENTRWKTFIKWVKEKVRNR